MTKKAQYKESHIKVDMTAHSARAIEAIALIRRAEQPNHTPVEFIKARHIAFTTLNEEVQAVAAMSTDFTIKSQALLNFNINAPLVRLLVNGPKREDSEVQHLLRGLKKLGVKYNFNMASESVDVRILLDRAVRYHEWLQSDEGKAYVHESRERHQKAESEWHAHVTGGGATAHLDAPAAESKVQPAIKMPASLERLPGQLLRPTA